MPLPQQVINQLSQDTPKTPGWSSNVLLFCSTILIIVLAVYFVLLFVYGPYLNGSLANVQGKVATLNQSVTSGDEANLVSFYSQVLNLQSVLKGHVFFSQFLTWLERNTEANIYYSQFSFASGDQVTLTGSARSESDISEQVAVFEASPMVTKVIISNAAFSTTNNSWTFTATLIVNSALFTGTAPSGVAPQPAFQLPLPATTSTASTTHT